VYSASTLGTAAIPAPRISRSASFQSLGTFSRKFSLPAAIHGFSMVNFISSTSSSIFLMPGMSKSFAARWKMAAMSPWSISPVEPFRAMRKRTTTSGFLSIRSWLVT
jgi:hypothetical protein